MSVRENLVKKVLSKKADISELTSQERKLAAEWYEKQVAPNTTGKFRDAARQYNQARANYRSCEKKASCFSSEDEFSRCRRDLNGRKTAIDYEA